MKIAIVGATGLVGQEVLRVLEERQVEFDELYLVASAKSVGQKIKFKGSSRDDFSKLVHFLWSLPKH